MIKKLIRIALVLMLAGLLIVGCSNDDSNGNGTVDGNGDASGNDEEQIMEFEATVLEIDENSILVEPLEGEDILRSADRVSVGTGDLDPEDVPEMEVGDTVRISYAGGVMESYPAQLGDVQKIELVEE